MIENPYTELAKQNYFRRVLNHTPLVKENMENLIKLHQSTTIFAIREISEVSNMVKSDWTNSYINHISPNLHLNEEVYEFSSELNVSYTENDVSFIKSGTLKLDILQNILINSITMPFISNKTSNKNLYNVIPLLLIFTNEAIENLYAGCYIFDYEHSKLMKIKSWENIDSHKLVSAFSTNQTLPSTYAMAYAIDMQKVASLNGKRDYRDTLVEIGAVKTRFENALLNFKSPINLGQFTQNEFSDNIVNHTCGTSVRLSPIVLVQWFGEVERQSI